MKYGNCWLYALPKWLKNPRKTYLIIRMSKYTFWPHVFFAESIDDIEVEEFQPLKPQKSLWGIFHALCFKGRVRKGKGEE